MCLSGSKVRWLKMAGISFHEVRHLLPEGTSLAKFREMCGLQETKGLFPFEKLEEDQSFLDEKELPASAEEWKSALGSAPTQEDVDEARREFAELGCADVRSWLSFYLEKDCLMLGKGFEALAASYFDLFRLDVIDSKKFSISSLSALACQANLFRNKKMGMFSVGEKRLYSILRRGLRGGWCKIPLLFVLPR